MMYGDGIDGNGGARHARAMLNHDVLAAGPGPFVLLLAALALDAYIGDPPLLYRVIPHPVALMGRLINWCDGKLNRDDRGASARRLRGVLATLALIGLAAGAGWLIHRLTVAISFGWLVELLVMMTLIAQRSLYRHVRAVAVALEEGGLAAGRDAVAHVVGRNPAYLDEYGVARGAIESCAENLSDGVMAPVFWYLLLGLPGLLAYKMLNTLDSMIGHMTPRHKAFGWATAKLDTVANYIPARLTGLVIVVVAIGAPEASPLAALKAMTRDAAKHRSVNAGWPEAAVAGALGIAIAGPRRYGERVVKDAWMGDGRARCTPRDIYRSLYLMIGACLVAAAIIAVFAAVPYL